MRGDFISTLSTLYISNLRKKKKKTKTETNGRLKLSKTNYEACKNENIN